MFSLLITSCISSIKHFNVLLNREASVVVQHSLPRRRCVAQLFFNYNYNNLNVIQRAQTENIRAADKMWISLQNRRFSPRSESRQQRGRRNKNKRQALDHPLTSSGSGSELAGPPGFIIKPVFKVPLLLWVKVRVLRGYLGMGQKRGSVVKTEPNTEEKKSNIWLLLNLPDVKIK